MDKLDLIIKIYYELDTVRLLARITSFATENEMENLQACNLAPILDDIEKRCRLISDLVEKLEDLEK